MSGIKKVNSNLDKFLNNVKYTKTDKCVYALASEGLAHSDVLVPMDTGLLLNSHYAPIIQRKADETTAYVGYRANYAGYVHEAKGKLKGQPRPNNRGYYWSPSGEPHFLIKGFKKVERDAHIILRRIYGI